MVFNRPIEQVLTYRVPPRLERIIQPGQRVRVPLGRGDKPAVGYCVRVDASLRAISIRHGSKTSSRCSTPCP